ncbi:hypothetical protein IG197_19970 [Aminobacter sp. SR38]|jgi:hypothetical protein|uniref:hypothetical protein n=1 Tax=unclassified Aminobacter TaxID=2644704 RepID=UPI0012AF06D2|nr:MULTISPECIES: hypothetical protein [unclassified Aminobacter]MRX37046.1 hypothetical protein [Aminobacter sp. MDW-2]QNH35023.1 hypothetical protein H5P29_03545 [Aminobacter sp. MDW-2]QOF70092.1 hypothetical protein IG197_19970 [Aminobacter sp. SR38]
MIVTLPDDRLPGLARVRVANTAALELLPASILSQIPLRRLPPLLFKLASAFVALRRREFVSTC